MKGSNESLFLLKRHFTSCDTFQMKTTYQIDFSRICCLPFFFFFLNIVMGLILRKIKGQFLMEKSFVWFHNEGFVCFGEVGFQQGLVKWAQ